MKKKNMFNWMLMAAVVLGLGMSFTACSDDDDKNGTEQTREDIDALDTDEARTAWRWLCALTDAESIDANWKSKTWEPTVGEPSENNEYTRIIVVNNLDDAKVDFARLANKDPQTLGSKVTVSGGAAGTMTWEPSATGAQNLAVVTVSSRIMPHLQKLVYCTQEQTGQNGLFGNDMKGTAYYRFGDVIKDEEGYYWVCVRPSFAPNDSKECKSKGDSHWINIFNSAASGGNKAMPTANIKDKWNQLPKYNKKTIILPTALKYDRTQIYNLSRLVWALINPEAYYAANTGVSDAALGEFPYTYHSKKFVEAVSTYWREKVDGYSIWEKLFNHTYEEMKDLKQMMFYYQGYSWKIGNSGYVWSYTTKGYEKSYKGDEDDDEEEVNFVNDGFDITYYAQAHDTQAFMKRWITDHDGNIGRWVVRYKTGEQLMTGGKYSYYSKLTSKTGKMTDVYRYNQKRGIEAGANITAEVEEDFEKSPVMPEHAVTTPKKHYMLAKNGFYYATKNDCESDKTEPVALVVGLAEDWSNNLETGTDYKYLLMALKSVDYDFFVPFGPNGHCCTVASNSYRLSGYRDGLAMTQKLQAGCSQGHNHQPAKVAWNATLGISAERCKQLNLSNGFLPSVGQIVIMLDGLWSKDNYMSDDEGWPMDDRALEYRKYIETLTAIDVNGNLGENGLSEYDFRSSSILSSTEKNDESVYRLSLTDDETLSEWDFRGKSVSVSPVTPFFLAK